MQDDKREIKTLLSAGIDPETRSRSGDTVLLWAIRYAYDDILLLTLEYNTNVNARDRAGWMALRLACCCSSLRVINMLIKAGADLEATDENGIIPLLQAAIMQNSAHVAELVLHGACIKGMQSNEWQRKYDCYLEQIASYMKQAQLLAREQTFLILRLLEGSWKLLKVLGQLIAHLSGTEGYDE